METLAKFFVAFSDLMEIFTRTERKMICKFSGSSPKVAAAIVKTVGSLLLLLLAPLLLIVLILVAFSVINLPVYEPICESVEGCGPEYRNGNEGYGYYGPNGRIDHDYD